MCRTVPIFWAVSGWLICSSSAVRLQLQRPAPLLPLDELCHSPGVLRCCSSLVNPLQGNLLHPSCLMLEKTLPDVFVWEEDVWSAVISFSKDEQSCKTEPQVIPGISLQPSPLNFKMLRKEPKKQLGDEAAGALLCSCKRKHNTSTEFLWGHLRQSLFTV